MVSALQTLFVKDLMPSPLNPRKQHRAEDLRDLAASIKQVGLLSPIVVRKVAMKMSDTGRVGQYEIVAGHRRYAAVVTLGWLDVACVVYEAMPDNEFYDVMAIDNLQRVDIHPMEEAEAYEHMMKREGSTVRAVAARVGREFRYVFDRLKLLSLTPELREAFSTGELTLAHAIVLARLSKSDQAAILEDEREGLFAHDAYHTSIFDAQNDDDDEKRKVRSVREIQSWVDKFVRFDVDDDTTRVLFADTAVAVDTARGAAAASKKRGVIPITEGHMVMPSAKDSNGARTYSAASWRRADGAHESKTCKDSVLGLVVAGAGRGTAYPVCIARDKCNVHFGRELKVQAERAKARELAKVNGAASSSNETSEEVRHELRNREQFSLASYTFIRPAVLAAIGERMAETGFVHVAWAVLKPLLWQVDIDDEELRAAMLACPLTAPLVMLEAADRDTFYADDDDRTEAVHRKLVDAWVNVGGLDNWRRLTLTAQVMAAMDKTAPYQMMNGHFAESEKLLGLDSKAMAGAVTAADITAYDALVEARHNNDDDDDDDDYVEDEDDENNNALGSDQSVTV